MRPPSGERRREIWQKRHAVFSQGRGRSAPDGRTACTGPAGRPCGGGDGSSSSNSSRGRAPRHPAARRGAPDAGTRDGGGREGRPLPHRARAPACRPFRRAAAAPHAAPMPAWHLHGVRREVGRGFPGPHGPRADAVPSRPAWGEGRGRGIARGARGAVDNLMRKSRAGAWKRRTVQAAAGPRAARARRAAHDAVPAGPPAASGEDSQLHPPACRRGGPGRAQH